MIERADLLKKHPHYLLSSIKCHILKTRLCIIFLDCCYDDTFGEKPYKGIYNYNTSLVFSDPITQKCTYKNQQNTLQNYRQCNTNLEAGAVWSDTNLKECKPFTETTEVLEGLVEVCFDQPRMQPTSDYIVLLDVSVPTGK